MVRVLLGILLFSSACSAYTPNDPEVIQMVDQGLRFLNSDRGRISNEGGSHAVDIVVGYTVFKAHHDRADPRVRKGIHGALQFIEEQSKAQRLESKFCYVATFSILLLCEVDRDQYRFPINQIARLYFSQQKSNGSFGYPSEQQGDTSMMQYAVLAFWTLHKHGFDVPASTVQRVALFLTQVQDSSGTWGYKNPPTNTNHRTPRFSLGAAGAGSLLIAGDYFGFYRGFGADPVEGLPRALIRTDPENPLQEKGDSANVTPRMIDDAVQNTLEFFQRNPVNAKSAGSYAKRHGLMAFYYYALYAHERFMSFYEMSIGDTNPEPDWYNQGVEELKRLQSADGGWLAEGDILDHIDSRANTCFAILFLIRSTQRAIAVPQTGTTFGGYDIPADTTNIKAQSGSAQLVDATPVRSVAELIGLLENDRDSVDIDTIQQSMMLSGDPKERAGEVRRLKRMVRGGSWQVRRVAVRLLGQTSDLETVPTLIYALTDPDSIVRREARNALRFVSRRFDGFGMPEEPNEKQIENAVRAWKNWYLRVNPSYVFVE